MVEVVVWWWWWWVVLLSASNARPLWSHLRLTTKIQMIQTERDENLARVLVFLQCWGGLQRSCTTICCCILDKINEFNCPFHRKQLYPQNQAFAHAHIIAHFCNGFHNSLIQIHRAGFLPFFRHFYKLFHDVAFFLRCTLYWIKIWNVMFYFLPSYYIIHYRRIYIHIYIAIYIYIYIYIRLPPPQTICIKVF